MSSFSQAIVRTRPITHVPFIANVTLRAVDPAGVVGLPSANNQISRSQAGSILDVVAC
jgi:hypothetical protein